jgi:secreted trypsin-like serine protease
MSAAGCFHGPGNLHHGVVETIVAGRTNLLSSTGQKILIQDIILHPDYDIATGYNNIAIVKLSTPLQFNSNVQPACLPNGTFNPEGGTTAFVSGWDITPKLKFFYVQKLDNNVCTKYLQEIGDLKFVSPNMVCSITRNNGDTCNGEEGGPLIVPGRSS